MNDEPASKKLKNVEEQCYIDEDSVLNNFLMWLNDSGIYISEKMKISKEGSCSRFGAIAVENITTGDLLFAIPRKSILWERNCSVSAALSDYVFNDKSGWVKLILCLMYEYTSANSKWLPYMKFVPSASFMDQPMFWTVQDRNKLLKGTGLVDAVNEDLKKIEKEYHEVALPFIKLHSKLGFDADIHNLQLYQHMVAIVMAYSFTEPNDDDDESNCPMMVPLADALNHVSKNNAQLEFERDSLLMKAIKPITAGEEIYNTYGQLSNMQLLQMYGFVEKFSCNIYDTVDIEVSLLFDDTGKNGAPSCAAKKMEWLDKERNLPRDFPLTFNADGVLSVDEFKIIAKIFPMNESDFETFQLAESESDSEENDDVTSDDEGEFEVFSFKKIKNCNSVFRQKLRAAAEDKMSRFDESVIEKFDETVNFDTGDLTLSRVSRSRILVQGQRRLLSFVIDASK